MVEYTEEKKDFIHISEVVKFFFQYGVKFSRNQHNSVRKKVILQELIKERISKHIQHFPSKINKMTWEEAQPDKFKK